MNGMDLTVTATRDETAAIRAITLARADGGRLPSWQPGAHVKVQVPEAGERCYSLVNLSPDPHAGDAPGAWLIGVRREDAGQGGSRFMHALRPGDRLTVAGPANDFALEPGERGTVLLAGGIGVTPILSMAAALAAARLPYRFVYAGRSRAEMAFLAEAEALAGSSLAVHADDEAGTLLDVAGLMQGLDPGERLYVCGPRAMIDAAVDAAKALGWAPGRLRFELFTTAPQQEGDAPFEVVLNSTGARYVVPPGRSILDVLLDEGVDALHDCKRGECGICQVGVVEGVPDHRDYVLSDAERAANTLIQICVSRAKTPVLVLDL